ncbi:MAG: hypothetical protein EAZ55_10100 [Cytophagales bacterium]|nr:MAG: hypothetical protein EAZ55_10100 [Cytophagales bacterium]
MPVCCLFITVGYRIAANLLITTNMANHSQFAKYFGELFFKTLKMSLLQVFFGFDVSLNGVH